MNFGTLRVARHPIVKVLVQKKKNLFGDKLLLYTNTAISCALSTLGDLMQQKYQLKKNELKTWNFKRTGHVAITGIVIGPFCHYWYVFLDWCFPGKSLKTVTKKIFVDQVICSPIVIGSFLYLTCLMERKTWSETKTEIAKKAKILYKAEWIVWPPAQLFNFYILPLKYRVLFDNLVSLGFDFYFSHVRYGKNDQHNEENVKNISNDNIGDSEPVYPGDNKHIEN